MSSQVNANKGLIESVVSETYPATVWYDLYFLFESGTWALSFLKQAIHAEDSI